MIRRPPRSTRTDTLFPYTTLFRSQPEAASTLTWANIGGAIGGALFGFLMKKWDIKAPTIVSAVLGAAAIAAFGIGSESLWGWRMRSEEHTSELQSLMRISYAVLCLKKKKVIMYNISEIHEQP